MAQKLAHIPEKTRVAVFSTSYPRPSCPFAGHFVISDLRDSLSPQEEAYLYGAPSEATSSNGGVTAYQSPEPSKLSQLLFQDVAILSHLAKRPWLFPLIPLWIAQSLKQAKRDGPFDKAIIHWYLPFAPAILKNPELYLKDNSKIEIVFHGSDVRLLSQLPRLVSRRLLAPLIQSLTRSTQENLPNSFPIQQIHLRFVSAELRALMAELCELPSILDCEVRSATLEFSEIIFQEEASDESPLTTPYFLIVSRLVTTKGLIDFAQQAHASSLPLVIIGEGPLRKTLEGLLPQALFLGALPRPQCLNWIANADRLISTSRFEGASTVIREAQHYQTKILAMRSGDLSTASCTQSEKQSLSLQIFDDYEPLLAALEKRSGELISAGSI